MVNSEQVRPLTARLFYVIGPSGSGKDSVINMIRERWPQHLVVAHRYITRDANAGGENHVALTPSEFMQRQQKQFFALNWQANGYSYGIGCEIDTWLGKGMDVIINGSRAYLSQAQQRYGELLVPVVIEVSTDILEQRLIDRGRESREEIELRLIRAQQLTQKNIKGSIKLNNSARLEQTIKPFNDYYQQRIALRSVPVLAHNPDPL